METKLSSGLLSRLLDFLHTGFGVEALMAETTDQVMMLTYLPKQERVFYTLFGSSRLSGSDVKNNQDV
jgi:hypothetical protein